MIDVVMFVDVQESAILYRTGLLQYLYRHIVIGNRYRTVVPSPFAQSLLESGSAVLWLRRVDIVQWLAIRKASDTS